MADKHGLNYDVRELKLGASFTNNKSSQYHTIKYDFKPASVDVNKMATVDVETNNQVTVTVPHLDGAGVPHTVFKGNQRPYTKECVLIIDRVTGEITLEKLSSNIQVKKTRQESSQKARPLTPVTSDLTNTTQRSTSRTRVATNRRSNNHSANAAPGAAVQSGSGARYPAAAPPPPGMVRSPHRVKSSPPQAPWSAGGNSTLASLPMIGLDDALCPPAPDRGVDRGERGGDRADRGGDRADRGGDRADRGGDRADRAAHDRERQERPAVDRSHMAMPTLPVAAAPPLPPLPPAAPAAPPAAAAREESSSSSSSDSGSDSGSDSDSDDEGNPPPQLPPQRLPNGTSPAAPMASLPTDVLNDDLCLSESGSDSD